MILLMALIIPTSSVVILFIFNMLYVNLKTRVPWAKVPLSNIEMIFNNLGLPVNSLVYDLGCGDGRFLFLAEKRGFRAVGYELAYYPYLKTLISKYIKGSKIAIENKDFFKQDLGAADAVFIFLTASVMNKIGLKLKNNLKAETTVVSYGFAIPGWTISNILETKPSKTYIYIK